MRDLKEAVTKIAAQTKVILRKAYTEDEVPMTTEIQNLLVTCVCTEGGQERK
jgi:hypothetical protein